MFAAQVSPHKLDRVTAEGLLHFRRAANYIAAGTDTDYSSTSGLLSSPHRNSNDIPREQRPPRKRFDL